MSGSSRLAFCRELAQKNEERQLYQKAAFSSGHSRYCAVENDYRMPYKRDVDRIIHSKAYARYVDKTQVFSLIENNHITYRGLHVQLVSNFSRGIAELLRLNTDLVESIALGHDVGHPPFGHEGEEYLSALSIESGNGPFVHPIQSCRLLSVIEPLNLGLAVYDGFLCHDGGMSGPRLIPSFGKTWATHHEDLRIKGVDPKQNIMPGTLEGCLVKLCDTVSYLGRDIEDAITLGIVERAQIPETLLGNTNKKILITVAGDIIENSYEQDYIAISDEVYQALQIIRKFNYEFIYKHPILHIASKKIKRGYRFLFETLLQDYGKRRESSYLWHHYLSKMTSDYLTTTEAVQMVIDYISCMTDRYFVRTLEKNLIPSPISWRKNHFNHIES